MWYSFLTASLVAPSRLTVTGRRTKRFRDDLTSAGTVAVARGQTYQCLLCPLVSVNLTCGCAPLALAIDSKIL